MAELTPAMKQFVRIKREHPNSLLLFRMGDFYETFFDDAKKASEILNITLTKRGTKNPVPLAGIPYHALDSYLPKLLKAGISVTIVEQVEDPKLAKGRIVKREVLRTITPGTITNADFLESKTNNYIVSIFKGKKYAIAFSDISTGEFKTTELNTEDALIHELVKLQPAEIIMPDNLQNSLIHRLSKVLDSVINPLPYIYYSYDFAKEEIKEHFSFSLYSFSDDMIVAIASLLYYYRITQKSKLKHISKIQHYDLSNYMFLDSQSINNLELVQNNNDRSSKNTLLEVINNTATSMGARFLKRALLRPLKNLSSIRQRQNRVSAIIEASVYDILYNILKLMPDIERISTKVSLGSANARDLVSLKEAIFLLPKLKESLGTCFDLIFNEKIYDLAKLIDSAIKDEPPLLIRDGNIIKKGFNKELDDLRDLKDNISIKLAEIEERERKALNIKNLKIRYNKIFGYFIELPKNCKVPEHYHRKQTLVNTERYITSELKEIEDKYLSSEERIKTIEYELFQAILKEVQKYVFDLYELSRDIAEIDFYNSLAISAVKNSYVRPKIKSRGSFIVKGGRHPVVEKIEDRFIKNDLYMDDDSHNFLIITGPNMAGKSTFLRQNALIIILAQIGSFVPADYVEMPVFDRIFTRIGARDNLALGQSTFMLEMIEVANILNNATENSFIILDEVGRGTSTFDGLSIAWAVAEYIHNKIKAKTLFATHYFEITGLEKKLKGVKNYHISVKEHNGEIIFLRKIVPGHIDKSYGIAVAKLASLPREVIERANEIEKLLNEGQSNFSSLKKKIKQNTLFDY